MILATVGTQLPFPRLLSALDRIAGEHGLEIVAQTCGNLARAGSIDQRPFLAPAEFDTLAARASVIVGHAGIGTIISAHRLSRPLILFPRRCEFGEHRNDHQLATARAVASREGIQVAWDEVELEALLTGPALPPLSYGSSPSRPALVSAIRDFIWAKNDQGESDGS